MVKSFRSCGFDALSVARCHRGAGERLSVVTIPLVVTSAVGMDS
jgi:hypothetical protein